MIRFGLARFGIPSTSDRFIRFGLDLSAGWQGELCAAKDIPAGLQLSEDSAGKVRLTVGVPAVAGLSAGWSGEVFAGKRIPAGFAVEAGFLAEVYAVKDIQIVRPDNASGVVSGRFGLMRFGVAGGKRKFSLSISMSERFGGLISAGKDLPAVNASSVFAASFSGRIQVTAGIPFLLDVQNVFSGNFRLGKDIYFALPCREELLSHAQAVKNIGIVCALQSEVLGQPAAVKDIWAAPSFFDALLADIQAAKDIPISGFLSEVVSALVSSYVLENETFRLNVTIPPGGTLTIDSDNFEAFLNNANVLHLQSGKWITLDRSLIELVIDSGAAGTLSGTVLYNERYL